jgi:hypothetical protein
VSHAESRCIDCLDASSNLRGLVALWYDIDEAGTQPSYATRRSNLNNQQPTPRPEHLPGWCAGWVYGSLPGSALLASDTQLVTRLRAFDPRPPLLTRLRAFGSRHPASYPKLPTCYRRPVHLPGRGAYPAEAPTTLFSPVSCSRTLTWRPRAVCKCKTHS